MPIQFIKDQLSNRLLSTVMPLLPKEELSQWVGKLVNMPLPQPLQKTVILAFAQAYGINLFEAEKSVEDYRTLGEFFTRRLKPGLRPIGEGFVHCADSVISIAGRLNAGDLLQAKGVNYSVEGLLRSPTWGKSFENGYYLTYYLCPRDYHRVHSSISGEIIWSNHIPGSLWPVNAWSTANVHGVFEKNERVAWVVQDEKGRRMAMVMVGATNVGHITVSFDQSISTADHSLERPARDKTYQPPVPTKAGDEIGIFHMGSTVVVLAESSWNWDEHRLEALCGQPTRVGESVQLN